MKNLLLMQNANTNPPFKQTFLLSTQVFLISQKSPLKYSRLHLHAQFTLILFPMIVPLLRQVISYSSQEARS